MKRDCREIQNMIIDGFYDEDMDYETAEHLKGCKECRELLDKLDSISEKLKLIDFECISVPSDMLGIINMAEDMKEERRKKYELLVFLGAALAILLSFAGIGIAFGTRVFLYIQLFIYSNMPLALLPIIKFKRAGEV